jgi:thiamine transport system permease protein
MDEDVAADRAGLIAPPTSPAPPVLPRSGQGGGGGRRSLLVVVPLLFLGAMFVLPVGAVVVTGLRVDGSWDLAGAWSELREGGVLSTAWFTVWQAALSSILTLAVALPGAYVLARFRFPGRRLLMSAVLIPFVLPTVVVGTAFLSLIGPEGALGVDLSGTVWAILVAHVFFNYAVVVRTVGGMLGRLDPRLEQASRVLGASPWRAFREVTWPLVRPAVVSSALVVFLFTFTSFGVVKVLGAGKAQTLETEIYTQTADYLNLRAAAVLALVQLLAVVAVLLVVSRAQRRAGDAQALVPESQVLRRPRTSRERWFVGSTVLTTVVLLGVPLAVLVQRSLSVGGSWSLRYYRALGEDTGSTFYVPPIEAIANSLRYAVLAALIALVVGVCAAIPLARKGRGRWVRSFDAMLLLPLGTSAVTVGFGILVLLSSDVTAPIGWIRDSPWLVPFVQALVAVPFVVRIAVPVLEAVDEQLREAAAVLGARPLRVWREVDLPAVWPGLAVAAGFAFAISLGEFGATVFLVRPDAPTLPVAVYRFLGRPGDLMVGQAMAMSVVLMLVTVVTVVLVDRVRVARVGAF